MVSLPDMPNELLFQVVEDFEARNLNALIRTNRRLSLALSPLLAKLAIQPENAKNALCWAVVNHTESLLINILEKGPPMALMRPVERPQVPTFYYDSNYESIGEDIDEGWEQAHRTPMKNGRDALPFIDERGANLHINDLEARFTMDRGSNPRFIPNSLLHWALWSGDTALVKRLLDSGACHWERDRRGEEPIFFAIKAENLEVVRLILGKENPEKTRIWALESAATDQHEDIVKLLLDNGVDVNTKKHTKSHIGSTGSRLRRTPLINFVTHHCSHLPTWSEQSERIL